MPPKSQAMNNGRHLLLLNGITPFRIIQLMTFKAIGWFPLHNNSTNSKVGSICLYIKGIPEIWQSEYGFPDNNNHKLLDWLLTLIQLVPCLLLLEKVGK